MLNISERSQKIRAKKKKEPKSGWLGLAKAVASQTRVALVMWTVLSPDWSG